jgi:hypothetical protein
VLIAATLAIFKLFERPHPLLALATRPVPAQPPLVLTTDFNITPRRIAITRIEEAVLTTTLLVDFADQKVVFTRVNHVPTRGPITLGVQALSTAAVPGLLELSVLLSLHQCDPRRPLYDMETYIEASIEYEDGNSMCFTGTPSAPLIACIDNELNRIHALVQSAPISGKLSPEQAYEQADAFCPCRSVVRFRDTPDP